MSKQPEKLLQNLVLNDYLSDVLGSATYVSISPASARIVEAADPEEQVCHIEWPNETNSYTKPHVWRIEDWRISHTRYLRRQALHTRERAIAVRASELRVQFIRQLEAATGLGSEQCRIFAETIIKQRNITSAALFKCDITELLEADRELQEFKKLNNIK